MFPICTGLGAQVEEEVQEVKDVLHTCKVGEEGAEVVHLVNHSLKIMDLAALR